MGPILKAMYKRKSAREKMNNPNLPQVVAIPANMQKRFGPGTMLLPSPPEIESLIRTVRKGSLATIGELRRHLAAKYEVTTTCPLLTGLFVRLAAEAAEESAHDGRTRIAPYWRVVKDDGSLNPKLPGGVERQSERLREEGHRILPARGKRPPRVDLSPRKV